MRFHPRDQCSAERKGSTIVDEWVADFGHQIPTEGATRLGTVATSEGLVPRVKNTLRGMTNDLQSDPISFGNFQLSTLISKRDINFFLTCTFHHFSLLIRHFITILGRQLF